MNFTHLENMLVLCEEASISAAAKRLHVSQPYISGMLKMLEKEIGYPLFERGFQGIRLTKQGEQFRQSSEIILHEYYKIMKLNHREEVQGLRIATYYAPFVMRSFLAFQKQYADGGMDQMKEMGNHEVIASLRQGKSKIGILFFLNSSAEKYKREAIDNECDIHPFLPPMSLYALMHPNHPAATHAQLTLEQLKTYPFVSYDDVSSRDFLTMMGFHHPQNILEVSDRGSLYDALSSAQYISVTALTDTGKTPSFAFVPLQADGLCIHSFYVTKKHYVLSKREQAFMDVLRKQTDTQVFL